MRLCYGLEELGGSQLLPVSLPVLGHPYHVPDWDWKGPSPSRAALWRNHYFHEYFFRGFCWPGGSVRAAQAGACCPSPAQSWGAAHKGFVCPLKIN